MLSRVYLTVWCPSVCPVEQQQQWRAAVLLLGPHAVAPSDRTDRRTSDRYTAVQVI